MRYIIASSLILLSSTVAAEVVEKPMIVGAFEQIITKGAFDIIVAVGKPRKIVARGDTAAVSRLRLDVDNGILTLRQVYDQNRSYKEPQRLKVTINMEKLTSVKLQGAGDVSITNVNAKEFVVAMSGAGDVNVAGTCTNLTANISGAGDLDADQLKCQNVAATVNGVGDVSVHASDTINGAISGIGDLVIYGNPKTRTTRATGIGDVSFR